MNRSHVATGVFVVLSATLCASPCKAQATPQQPPAVQTPQPAPQPPTPPQAPTVPQAPPTPPQAPNTPPPRPQPGSQPGVPAPHPGPAQPRQAARPAAPATPQQPKPAEPAKAAPAEAKEASQPHRRTKATGILADDVAVRGICHRALTDVMNNRPDRLEKKLESSYQPWRSSGEKSFRDYFADQMGRYGYVLKATYLSTEDVEVADRKGKARLGRQVFFRVVTSKYMEAAYDLAFTVVASDRSLHLADYEFVPASKGPRKD